MEITLTGFNPQAAQTSVDVSRQQQAASQREQQQNASGGRRVESEQANRSRAEQTQRTTEPARVINGEVLSSESTRVTPQETYRFESRSSSNQQLPNSEPDTRRIPIQQALQNFQQNQTLATDPSSPRQVSGIIDEFV